MAEETIIEVINAHKSGLMKISGVVGVGEGTHNNEPCIVVFVNDKESPEMTYIPEIINGYRVKIIESGEFRSLTNPG